MNVEQNKTKLLNRLARNLGLESVRSGSYLHTLADGLYNVTEEVLAEINTDILNLNIDTADEETLEVLGVNLGAPRLKDRYLNFIKESKDAKIQVILYKNDDSILIPMYSKGQVLEEGPISLTMTEDFIYDASIPENNYVSCILRIKEGSYSSALRVGDNQTISLPNPNPELIKEVNFTSKKERRITDTIEDLSSYRKRLLALTQTQNISGEDVLRKVLASNGIYKYFIKRDNGAHIIYCLVDDMYQNLDPSSTFAESVLPRVRCALEESKPFGAYLDVRVAKVVNLILEIKTESKDITDQIVYEFLAEVQKRHTLGKAFRIERNVLEDILKQRTIEAAFDLKTFVDFAGYREEIRDLVIEADEYPRFLAVNVYGSSEEG